jgi:hypothetical protein
VTPDTVQSRCNQFQAEEVDTVLEAQDILEV